MSNIVIATKPNEIPLTEEQLVHLWLASKKSQHTQNQYQRYLTQFQTAISPLPLKQVTSKVIEIYLQSLVQTNQFKPASVNLRLAAIKSFYRYLLKSELISYNPSDTVIMDNIKENTNNKSIHNIRHKSIDAVAINRLIEQLDGKDKLIIATLYYTGVRVSELIKIRLQDFTDRGGQLTLTVTGKGNKTREVIVPTKLTAILNELGVNLASNSWLLQSKDYYGNPKAYSRNSINYRLKQMAKKYGVNSEVSPHWFRHSHATNALKKGANLREIQQQLGHSSLNTTQQYLDATELGNSGSYL